MSDDLLNVLTGGQEQLTAPAPHAATVDPTDYLVRTVYGEADPQADSRQAVAGVILNRARKSGKSYDQVVQEPGQFEAWSDPKARARMLALDPSSETYKQIATEIQPVLKGDVSVPYTHFYSPGILKTRGQGAPDWAQGDGTAVGTQRFYTVGAPTPDLGAILGGEQATDKAADDAFRKAFGDGSAPGAAADPNAPTGPATVKQVGGKVVFGDTGQPVPDAQVKAAQTLFKAGKIDSDGKIGGKTLWMQRAPEDPIPPGDFYVEAGTGKLRQSPRSANPEGAVAQGGGASVPSGHDFVGGVSAGLGDVPNSLLRLVPFGEGSDIRNAMEGNRLIYDATHAGDRYAQAGRFLGQVAGSALPIVGGESVLGQLAARAPAAAAPVADFLAGNAGRAGGNLLLRGTSLAARGAAEGAGQALTTSAASDRPLGEQVATGAVTGAVVNPALTGAAGLVGGGINKLMGRTVGAADAASQRSAYDTAINLPVPVKLTPGQLSLSPAEQMTENALLRGASGSQAAHIMRDFAAEQQGALRGNTEAIGAKMAGGAPPTTGQGGSAVSETLNAKYDAAKKGVDAAYDAARSASDGAYLPAAERGVMTQTVRGALSDYDIGGVPRVKSVLDSLDQSPTSSTFTPTDIFDARSKLTTLRASNDPVEAGAAGKAVKALDGFVDDAVNRDLISGDPSVVNAWKTAISARRDMGKMFEGNDLIQALTTRTVHGEGVGLKVSPEDASNYIFGRSDLGFVGKQNLTRDLTRLRTTLGADSPEWNGLRSEAFARIARAGEGAPEGGQTQFSGQKFFKAWNAAKTKDPQIVQTLFTPEERQQIDGFAEIAQRATTPVKGGDNASNSGVYIASLAKKALDNLGAALGAGVGSVGGPGGAAAGAAAGRVFDTFMRDAGAVAKAKRITAGKPPAPSAGASKPVNPLFPQLGARTAATVANNLIPSP